MISAPPGAVCNGSRPRSMAKMNHPAIVHVCDFGETTEGQLYIVMEYIDGTDVARMIQAEGRLPEGLREHEWVDEEGGEVSYTLSYVDAAGNQSPKSEAVKAR